DDRWLVTGRFERFDEIPEPAAQQHVCTRLARGEAGDDLGRLLQWLKLAVGVNSRTVVRRELRCEGPAAGDLERVEPGRWIGFDRGCEFRIDAVDGREVRRIALAQFGGGQGNRLSGGHAALTGFAAAL